MSAREEVERALGRPLTEAEQAPAGRLEHLTEAALAVAAALPSILRHWYLRSLVDESDHPWVPSYVEDVLDGEVPSEQWGRGGILLPGFALPDLLTSDVADILGAIPLDGGTWRRYRLSRERWQARDEFAGAPAAQRPDLDRRFEPPPNVKRVHTRATDLEPEPAPERLARRWIASRVARIAAGRAEEEPEAVVRAVFPDLGGLSADASVALLALAREQRDLGASDTEVPGFRGPDDWYERPS